MEEAMSMTIIEGGRGGEGGEDGSGGAYTSAEVHGDEEGVASVIAPDVYPA